MAVVQSPPVRRHALGLPGGSVRAVLALMIVGLFCALLLIPTREPTPIPPYLLYLLFMALGHFFAAHGNTIASGSSGEASPLYLPRGFIRVVLIVGLSAAINWKLYNDLEGFKEQLKRSVDLVKDQPFIPVIILSAFFIGVIVRSLVGRDNPPAWFQDIEAWFALIAVVLLCVDIMIKLIINPSLDHPINLPEWEGILAGVIAFYFGERS
jgi:hypothetical protein